MTSGNKQGLRPYSIDPWSPTNDALKQTIDITLTDDDSSEPIYVESVVIDDLIAERVVLEIRESPTGDTYESIKAKNVSNKSVCAF